MSGPPVVGEDLHNPGVAMNDDKINLVAIWSARWSVMQFAARQHRG